MVCKTHPDLIIIFCLASGLVTNGEFNSMRMKGNTRPLSVFQIRAQARAKYAQMGQRKMMNMLTPLRKYE